MINSSEKKLAVYSTLFIVLLLNSPKLMALREGSLSSQFLDFNLKEFVFQVCFNVLYCFAIFYLNLTRPISKSSRQYVMEAIVNIAPLLTGILVGYWLHGLIQGMHSELLFKMYSARIVLSHLSVYIVIVIIRSQQKSRLQEEENARLKHVYMEAQIQVLRQQLNPHFFFNSLSSLSAIVDENPGKVQHYINHLSKIFRYALRPADGLISLEEELKVMESYLELIQLRFGEGFQLSVKLDVNPHTAYLLHMSLQPLLENAVKHNVVALQTPLRIEIFTPDENTLAVRNNVQRLKSPEAGTNTGLSNLSDRYMLSTNSPVFIESTDTHFCVFLPLTHQQK